MGRGKYPFFFEQFGLLFGGEVEEGHRHGVDLSPPGPGRRLAPGRWLALGLDLQRWRQRKDVERGHERYQEDARKEKQKKKEEKKSTHTYSHTHLSFEV